MTILTISSQVLFGHVGNSVADFALRRLGFEVVAVPTVILSNHKGYPDAVGEATPPALLRDHFEALGRRGVLDRLSAVQTGFFASPAQAKTVFDLLDSLRSSKPDLPIIIDPVMGDKGRLYVETGLVELFQNAAPGLASLITPNAFEAETLAGRPVSGLEDLRSQLQAIGFSAGLVTSAEAMAPDISGRGVFCFDAAETTLVEHRGIAFEREPNGVGDFIAALSTGLYTPGQGLPQRTARICAALVRLLERTQVLGLGELALVQAQADWTAALDQADEASGTITRVIKA